MTLQPELEKWIQEHRFPKDGNKNPEHQSFVIREADLRTFLAQFVLCAPEVVARATRAGGVYINQRGDHVFGDTPLHAPAKGLPEASDTQEQTP